MGKRKKAKIKFEAPKEILFKKKYIYIVYGDFTVKMVKNRTSLDIKTDMGQTKPISIGGKNRFTVEYDRKHFNFTIKDNNVR